MEKIKNEKGKNIWLFGGGDLTTSLMNLKLVDEIWLAVHPVILGGGKSMFTNLKTGQPKTYGNQNLFNRTFVFEICILSKLILFSIHRCFYIMIKQKSPSFIISLLPPLLS